MVGIKVNANQGWMKGNIHQLYSETFTLNIRKPSSAGEEYSRFSREIVSSPSSEFAKA